ncbi:antibiotic biosynthesis monooxygenase family protein [Streptacidiphilus melanogenes]|uniref:antibiotic biosynthesis monooxygenase family protein n=1 Tax=Streptacidiphilus melanogenes TaxID=411235 RepID=UPI0005A7E38B|nr:antibiotic biosynthesis monooxygenase family protein [Streptacidiphilus melanogenes]
MTAVDSAADAGLVRVLLRMEVRPGTEADFEQTWLEIGRRIAEQPANLGQQLVRSTTDPHVYFVVTDWADETSFRTFELSAPHQENRAALNRFRVAGEMTVTRLVHRLEVAS